MQHSTKLLGTCVFQLGLNRRWVTIVEAEPLAVQPASYSQKVSAVLADPRFGPSLSPRKPPSAALRGGARNIAGRPPRPQPQPAAQTRSGRMARLARQPGQLPPPARPGQALGGVDLNLSSKMTSPEGQLMGIRRNRNRAAVLTILMIVGVFLASSRLNPPHLDHRCTNLQWIDFRRGKNPLVIRIEGSAQGPTQYTAKQGVHSKSGYLVTAQYADWIECIRMHLPTLLKEEPRGEIIAELVITQENKKWGVQIGKQLSPASSRILREVGNELPGLDGPP